MSLRGLFVGVLLDRKNDNIRALIVRKGFVGERCRFAVQEQTRRNRSTDSEAVSARREFWDEIHCLTNQGLTVLVSTHYMDEAERCHSIHYIANGKLKASGTVEQVIKLAGLTTYVMAGKKLPEAIELLKSYPCVLQIAPFGLNLHVVGNDPNGLASAVDQVSQLTGCHAHIGETSLGTVLG